MSEIAHRVPGIGKATAPIGGSGPLDEPAPGDGMWVGWGRCRCEYKYIEVTQCHIEQTKNGAKTGGELRLHYECRLQKLNKKQSIRPNNEPPHPGLGNFGDAAVARVGDKSGPGHFCVLNSVSLLSG